MQYTAPPNVPRQSPVYIYSKHNVVVIMFVKIVILLHVFLLAYYVINSSGFSQHISQGLSNLLTTMPPKPKLNVQSFPRPPLIEKTNRHLQVKYQGQIIADTKDAYWVLETYHPPSMFYLSIFFISLSRTLQSCQGNKDKARWNTSKSLNI